MKYLSALLMAISILNVSYAEDGAQRSKEFNQSVKERNQAASDARERAKVKAQKQNIDDQAEVDELIQNSSGTSGS